MSEKPVDRVPPRAPLSAGQMTAVALIEQGYSVREAARMMGCGLATLRTHLDRASVKVPGDLPRDAKLVAWYRGASAAVLGVGRQTSSRQDALKLAYAISVQTRCVACGTLVAHGKQPGAASEGHE